jgi:acetylornithine deacetylase
MKGFIACCLSVLPQLVKANLKRPIYFAFSYDEEIGCLSAPDLIAHLQVYYSETPQYAIIGEPSLGQPIIGHKGICLFTTTVNGSAGHSSGIRKEVSAIHEAARLILWLENKMETLATSLKDDRFSPPHSSIHIGTIQGGIAANVIADHVSFSWDVRVIPGDNLNAILKDFEFHCKSRTAILKERFPNFSITTTPIHPAVTHFDSAATSDIVKLMSKINPNTELATVAYASEAGQYNAAGLQSIICGPGSIDQAHRANEFVAKEELNNYVVILENLIRLFSN